MESAFVSADLGRYRRLVQMLWDPEPSNDVIKNQTAWCLGRPYNLHEGTSQAAKSAEEHENIATSPTPSHSNASQLSSVPNGGGWPLSFIQDFRSRIWMTYRSGFEPIAKVRYTARPTALSLSGNFRSQAGNQAGFSSDSGWGCMIRSGQSLLANALILLRLGRDWRREELHSKELPILSLFADDPRAPYSIHNFVQHAAIECGKKPGEWFGPSATARCIQALVNERESDLRVYSSGDGPDIYEDRFLNIASPNGLDFHPTLVLIGTRLGIDKITPVYWEALTASLQLSQSVGIAGGRPSSSYYFIGSQGSFLFYLDPHQTRPALPFHADTSQYAVKDIESCYTSRLRKIHLQEVDPSMLIGFLIRTKDDWVDWRKRVKQVQGKAVIHVANHDEIGSLSSGLGESAMDRVDTFGDEDNDHIDVA